MEYSDTDGATVVLSVVGLEPGDYYILIEPFGNIYARGERAGTPDHASQAYTLTIAE